MAHYLVTGGCGFMGARLTGRLLREGHRVTILDNLSTGRLEDRPSGIRLILGDVADPRAVHDAVAVAVDGIFHLAGSGSIRRSRERWAASHRTNQSGAVTVLEAARGAARGGPVPVVYASCAGIYGTDPPVPVGEDAPLDPRSAVAVDRLGTELHARVAWEEHGVPTVGFRLFDVYGPGARSGLVAGLARPLAAGDDVTVEGDGERQRDLVFIDDAVAALAAGMQRCRSGAVVCNLCTGRPVSVLSLAHTLGELSGRRVRHRPGPPPPRVPRALVGDPARLRAVFGVACRVGLLEGLSATLNGLRP